MTPGQVHGYVSYEGALMVPAALRAFPHSFAHPRRRNHAFAFFEEEGEKTWVRSRNCDHVAKALSFQALRAGFIYTFKEAAAPPPSPACAARMFAPYRAHSSQLVADGLERKTGMLQNARG